MWTIGNDFKPAYLLNEMLVHLVDDSFLVYELCKHRAHWKGDVFNFDQCVLNLIGLIFIVLGQHCQQHPEKPHVKASAMILLMLQVSLATNSIRNYMMSWQREERGQAWN
jgi:hypothetical protein